MKRTDRSKSPTELESSDVAEIAEALRPAELSAVQRSSMRAKIAARIGEEQPPHTQTIRGEEVEWQAVWPNVWAKMLRFDAANNIQTLVLRIKPGGVVPAHAHTKEEECLVLEGEAYIGSHRICEGDLHIAHPGAAHRDITTLTGATLMVRSEIPPGYLAKVRDGSSQQAK
jgi:quercetin dioxygenase-like cupin family protein